jgi:predicted PurR-regulated permease PerM
VSSPDPRALAAKAGRRSISLAIIATVAAGAALYFAQEVFVPLVLGLLLSALFRPVVGLLSRIRISAPVSATLIILACLGLLGAAGYFLAAPIQTWVRDAPKTLSAARGKIDKLRQPIKKVSEAVEKAQQEVTGGGEKQQTGETAQSSSGFGVSSFLGRVFATTTGILGTLLQTIVIVFVVLATGDLLTRKIAVVMPRPAQGSTAQAVEEAEAVVRRYLVVTALLAGGQGVVVALVFMLLGMPSPILWGVLTFLLECLPYIGALFMVAAVSVTAFAAFEGIGQILLPPLAYITISAIQNNLISPFAYGSGLRLNPLAILLVVLVGWFLWGVAGAFAAVPVLAAVKIFTGRLNRESRLAAILAE